MEFINTNITQTRSDKFKDVGKYRQPPCRVKTTIRLPQKTALSLSLVIIIIIMISMMIIILRPPLSHGIGVTTLTIYLFFKNKLLQKQNIPQPILILNFFSYLFRLFSYFYSKKKTYFHTYVHNLNFIVINCLFYKLWPHIGYFEFEYKCFDLHLNYNKFNSLSFRTWTLIDLKKNTKNVSISQEMQPNKWLS